MERLFIIYALYNKIVKRTFICYVYHFLSEVQSYLRTFALIVYAHF